MQIQIITTREELQDTIDRAVQKALGSNQQPQVNDLPQQDNEIVRGIAGLAEILKCTLPTAQRLKNSGKIPFYQDGRTLLFKKHEVFNALRNSHRKIA